MSNYDKWVKGNGFFTTEAEQMINKSFLPAIREFLDNLDTENEIRIVSSILSNLIGKTVANTIQQKQDKTINQ